MFYNRLTGWSGGAGEVQLDYWVVRTRSGGFAVTAEEARRITLVMQRRFVPRWVTFRDLSGSEIRVRSADVMLIGESTREQRAYDRRLSEALEAEQGGSEPWEA